MKARRTRKGVMPTGDERGIALVIALWVATVLYLLGLVFLSASATENTISSNEIKTARAFELAEAGIEHAKRALEKANLSAVLNGTDDVFAGAGKGKGGGGNSANLGGGSYTVQVTNNYDDMGIDFPRGTIPADPSGSAAVDGDLIIVVASTGTFLNSEQAIEAIFRITRFPMVPGSVVQVSKGENEFDFEDGTLVSGFDESGTCPDRPAFVNNSPDLNLDMEGGVLEGALEGDPTPWRDYDPALDDPIYGDPDALVGLVNAWMNFPGVVTITGDSPPPTLGTPGSPQITVWDIDPAGDELVIESPPMTGYGILIVTGELALEGDFEFHGLIVQRSKRQLTIGKGGGDTTQVVHGAVLAVDDQPPLGGEDTKVDLEDEAQVLFNCDALNTYAKPMVVGSDPVSLLSWRQR